MSMLSFNHLLSLSFNFHTHRKTGEVLRILDRGAAINHTLELILFNIIPTFIDIFVALIFFCIYFEWTLALVIFFVFAAYGELSSRIFRSNITDVATQCLQVLWLPGGAQGFGDR